MPLARYHTLYNVAGRKCLLARPERAVRGQSVWPLRAKLALHQSKHVILQLAQKLSDRDADKPGVKPIPLAVDDKTLASSIPRRRVSLMIEMHPELQCRPLKIAVFLPLLPRVLAPSSRARIV